MLIGLDNIEDFSIPLQKYNSQWIFTDENEKLASVEHQDQIFPLTREAANFLWNFESTIDIVCTEKYFKSISRFDSSTCNSQIIKKYLYNLGIPFSQKVFIAMQPDTGFVLSWKMVIKYSHRLFWANDQTVWDRTLNWKLEYHHDGEYTFGRNLIFDGQEDIINNRVMLSKTLEEMEERRRSNNG